MKYYYSIANFAVGTFTNIFNKFFYTETQTYQQLFGEMLIWSRGNNVSVENLVNSNIIPQQFVDSWGEDLARNITNEFTYHILNLEHSNNWNGDLLHTIPLSLPQVIMDWSTVTTIGAGILDTIGYYTNYSLLSWSSPICLPNIIWQNVLLGGLVGVGVGLGVVGIIGLELVPGVLELVPGGGLVGLGAGGGLVGLRVVGLGYAGEIFLQYVTDTTIISIVEKHGLESIKPLH